LNQKRERKGERVQRVVRSSVLLYVKQDNTAGHCKN
jgi:hypothetical protein